MDGIFSCCHCSEEGEETNMVYFKKHYRSYHTSFKVECNMCWNRFPRERDLTEHKDVKHGIRRRPPREILCVHCNGKSFPNDSAREKHYKDLHRRFKSACKRCGNMFLCSSDVIPHLKSCQLHAVET